MGILLSNIAFIESKTRMVQNRVPTFDKLMNPTIQALIELGGSGTIEEINRKAVEIADLSDEQLDIIHNPVKGSQSEVEYRLAWARTYLKKYGVLENSDRGVWALTPQGQQTQRVNPQTVKQFVRDERRNAKAAEEASEEDMELTWREELLHAILQMSPSAFERLIQRLLRRIWVYSSRSHRQEWRRRRRWKRHYAYRWSTEFSSNFPV